MWYDIWSFSYKQQILNFWSRSEMVRKLRFQTGLSENCVFGPPGEPVFSKILKNYFFMISFISFNDIITFLKHLGKMTFLRLYLPLSQTYSWVSNKSVAQKKSRCERYDNFNKTTQYLHMSILLILSKWWVHEGHGGVEGHQDHVVPPICPIHPQLKA